MAIEAPYSRYKKQNFVIGIVLLLAFGAYCVYDGYLNTKFIEKHTNVEGVPDATLAFNQKAPFLCIPGAIVLAIWLSVAKKKKITAEEDGIIMSGGKKIAYQSIEKIDKTYFDAKDYFVITYKDENGKEAEQRFDGRGYDNLAAILDELVSRIS
jgi:hypothetical protein